VREPIQPGLIAEVEIPCGWRENFDHKLGIGDGVLAGIQIMEFIARHRDIRIDIRCLGV